MTWFRLIVTAIGVVSVSTLAGLRAQTTTRPVPVAGSATAIADEYVSAYVRAFPDTAAVQGLPGADHGRFQDRSTNAVKEWAREQDAFLVRLQALAEPPASDVASWVVYGQLKERLEADRGLRVCRFELWSVNQMDGWQIRLPRVMEQQPLATADEQQAAVRRWRAFPQYVDVEIQNLQEGLRLGYSAPRRIAQLVVTQLDQLLAAPVEQSPFFPAAARDKSPELDATWRAMVAETINPAIKRYRDHLATTYAQKARVALGVSANPDGRACYDASFRSYTTLTRTARETSDRGAERVRQFHQEAKQIARQRFGTDDLDALARRIQADRSRHFSSRDEMLTFARDAVARGEKAVPQLFGRMPRATVRVEPYPAYMEATASDSYQAAPPDGSRPGIYRINLRSPKEQLKADQERTSFHETFPGHHLQVGLATELPSAHLVGRLTGNSAFGEGWARYAENIAEELGLYTEEYARISRRRWPGRGMVVDPGIHLFGWTRERAVAYMIEGGQKRDDAELLVDRIMVWPAQLTAYDTGGLEFEALRSAGRAALNDRFDIKAFHDAVLSVGRVPFPMLRTVVNEWVSSRRSGRTLAFPF